MKDLGNVELDETCAFIPPKLPQGTKFYSMSAMIQPLTLKRVFVGLRTDDANIYIMNFYRIKTSYNLDAVSQ